VGIHLKNLTTAAQVQVEIAHAAKSASALGDSKPQRFFNKVILIYKNESY
jgi:hypothetical protein